MPLASCAARAIPSSRPAWRAYVRARAKSGRAAHELALSQVDVLGPKAAAGWQSILGRLGLAQFGNLWTNIVFHTGVLSMGGVVFGIAGLYPALYIRGFWEDMCEAQQCDLRGDLSRARHTVPGQAALSRFATSLLQVFNEMPPGVVPEACCSSQACGTNLGSCSAPKPNRHGRGHLTRWRRPCGRC